MTVKRVILIRPGETDWNRQGRWQGWVASPLNPHGKQQVQALARFIRNVGMTVLYASDLKRAVETAEILEERLGFAPIYDERLRERNIGDWQGLTPDEMRLWYPQEYEKLLQDRANYVIPKGESRNQVKARMLAAFKDYLQQDKGETIGILSHSSAIRSLLSEWIPEAQLINADVGNTSVTSIARDDENGTWRVVASNDVTHLEGLEAQSVTELEDRKHDSGNR
jgi:broad specificity phosphatase PhoE